MSIAEIKETVVKTTDEYQITGGIGNAFGCRARYWRDARSPSGQPVRSHMWIEHRHQVDGSPHVQMELQIDGHRRLVLVMTDEMLCNLRDVVNDIEATIQGEGVHRIVEVV